MTQADDERAIKDVLLRWCRAIDRLDLPAVRALFHADATDDHVFYSGGVEGLIIALANRHRRIPFSCHQIGNCLIEYSGPTIALVETYAKVTQHVRQHEGATVVQSSWCRYIDRFEQRNGPWRIAHRLLVIDAAVESTLCSPEVFGILPANQGRRDLFDPIYSARSALGLGNDPGLA
ncbi:nuclear transport factor 2 family protein (plasmid) [Paraburkholderia graminis]|uniref:nuclear transport factor 2 family protein n=1 Tax=Paraburkholderia graminis TaxID=60548 RepID=UPI000DEF98C2|nr:nuclear transport factor 2 family protein [Paraburkholderia graminis]AXF12560.1 nuclear transport factor 2 family protein [Paraburkholderia graminis]